MQAIKEKVMATSCALVLFCSSQFTFAQGALPKAAPPSRGQTDGNFIKLLQDYAYDIFILAGLVIGVVAFFAVAKNVLTAYSDVGADPKKGWGGVAAHAGVGVVLIVFIIFLLTEASKIL